MMAKKSCSRTTGLGLALVTAWGVVPFPAPATARLVDDSAIARSGATGDRVVWVALEGAHKIAKVDLRSHGVLKRRSVRGAPHNLTISPSGRTIAATLWRAGSIVARHKGRQRTVELGGAPHDVKIGGGRIVVANQSEARLDVVTPRGEFRRSIRLKADPHDVALRWGGRQAWVTLEGSDDLAAVRIRRPSRVRYFSTGKAPHDLLFAPDGKLWVSDWDGAMHVFSKRGRRLKTIPIGVEAHHLDFTPDGRQAWITDHAAQRIFVVSAGRYKIRKRFSVSGAPHHVALTADGDRAAVADHERGLIIVYNVNRLRRGKAIRVGSGPHGIWATP
jgi:DNA-binding beta-propeller fold protein YncE